MTEPKLADSWAYGSHVFLSIWDAEPMTPPADANASVEEPRDTSKGDKS